MALFEMSENGIARIAQTTLAAQGLRERYDLQKHLRDHIEVISDELLVISEEFDDWDASRRRIDLLCIDKAANLVVIELKRDADPFMDLQAIRYASMVSVMSFKEVVEVFSNFLQKTGKPGEAEQTMLAFLKWDSPQEKKFGQTVNIILVAGEFAKELTSSVLWLNDAGLNIQCVKLQPYEIAGRLVLDVQQIIPLPEAAVYQIRLRKKIAEERQASTAVLDRTRYDLWIGDKEEKGLSKRSLIFSVVHELVANGVGPEEITAAFGSGTWLPFNGNLTSDEFKDVALTTGVTEDRLRRYTVDGEHLFHIGDKTYALSNQWSRYNLPSLGMLIAKYQQFNIRYAVAAAAAGAAA